jgi:Flp pilus assembly protein TadG
MFRENQSLLLSSRAKRGIWVLRIGGENPKRFALGWRSAFSAAICALQSGAALAAEVIRASFSGLPRTQKRKTNRLPKDERTVGSQPLEQRFNLLCSTDAAALIEFAVALPLLVVLIVGIFDFGGAFNLKQKLNNAAREGARFGASQPTNDLSMANPPSVNAVRFLVDSYLRTAKINDCGLSTATWSTGGGLIWTFNARGGSCSMTLTISRGFAVQETVGGSQVNILCTTVNIIYPYQWHFNSVIQLLVPGASYTFTDLHSDTTVVNMD